MQSIAVRWAGWMVAALLWVVPMVQKPCVSPCCVANPTDCCAGTVNISSSTCAAASAHIVEWTARGSDVPSVAGLARVFANNVSVAAPNLTVHHPVSVRTASDLSPGSRDHLIPLRI